MRESYAPVILARKAARLRKETGNEALRSKLDTGLSHKELLLRSIVRPTKMLLFSPICCLFSIYMSVCYGILYLLFTTYTFVFEKTYHFSSGTVGLTYIATGVGMLAGLAFIGPSIDRAVKKQKALGREMKPEHRIPLWLTLPGAVSLPIGLFIYGWTAQYHVHWAVPLLGTCIVGFGLLAIFVSLIPPPYASLVPTKAADVRADVPCRRFHRARSISNGRKYRPSVSLRRYSTVVCVEHVRQAWSRLGELADRVHLSRHGANPCVFCGVWGEAADESEVSDQFLKNQVVNDAFDCI